MVAKQPRRPPRRVRSRRDADILRRLTEVEDVARTNRRELELQFRRIADMQAELDKRKSDAT
jgi:hypothetical protein